MDALLFTRGLRPATCINELQDHAERMRTARDLENWDSRKTRDLVKEVLQLQLRLGMSGYLSK